jgi:tetratricopeptide (TPR) repeat protein
MKIAGMLAAVAFVACLAAGGAARADGGSDSNKSDTPTCNKGEAYDASTHRCVRADRGILPDEQLTQYAWSLIRAGRYAEALATLDLLRDPNTAVALNYRGFATRKLGRVDEGIGWYLKSVARDPHYAQVREYLGEAYLLKGDAAQAKAQLAAIKGICGTTCEAYEHLAVAIADPADL